MEELIKEFEQLKEQQRKLLKSRVLDVPALNKVNKRMFEIREQLKRLKIKETDEIGLYIY